MKKQIFSLMLSAAIFTTSPLFAMDREEMDSPRTTSTPSSQLFTPGKDCEVLIEDLISFRNQAKRTKEWIFSISGRNFSLVNMYGHDDDDKLEILNPKARVTFTWEQYPHPSSFRGNVYASNLPYTELNLSSKEYEKIVLDFAKSNKYCYNGGDYMKSGEYELKLNSFSITEEK